MFEKINLKATEIFLYFKAHPQVIVLAVIGIILLVLFCMCIDELYIIHKNRKIEKKGKLLKILVKDTVNSKATEALIRNIHSTILNTKYREFTQGKPWVGYEIVAEHDKITFYIWIPKDYKDLITERIYATYPEIAIEEIEQDYLETKIWFNLWDKIIFLIDKYIRKKKGLKKPKNHLNIYGTEMELAFHHVLSLNKQIEKEDIITSILSAMKNLEWHEKAIVQILAKPLNGTWQFRGKKVLEDYVLTGKRPSKTSRGTSFNTDKIADEMDEILKNEISEINLPAASRSSSSRKTPYDRKEITTATEKLFDVGYETVIRIATIGNFRKGAKSRLKMLSAAFNELDKENKLKRKYVYAKRYFYNKLKNRRIYIKGRNNILSAAELSKFFMRLPSAETIDSFGDIEKLLVKEFAPPKGVETEKLLLGENKYRGKITPIGFKFDDIKRHVIVQGKTGTGKSEFAKSVLTEIMKQGLGFALFEPHGKLATEVLHLIPENRRKDVIIFDLMSDYPPPFNLCKISDNIQGKFREQTIEKVTNELVDMNAKLFSDAWSARNAYYLQNAIKTVIEIKGNYIDIRKLFTDTKFRETAVKKLHDSQLIHFWKTEFTLDGKGNLSAATLSTVNSIDYKLGSFLNTKSLLRAVGQDDTIDFKQVLDENKILVFRFDKERMSEEQIQFIGGIAIRLMMIAAFMRDSKQYDNPFVVLIDEAQNFVDTSIKTMLAETRKYGFCLFFMHQILEQLDKVKGLKDALYGNVGSKISFTAGDVDAPWFAKVFQPRIDEKDMTNLPSRYAYCRLMVDGAASETFNFHTYDSPQIDEVEGKKCYDEVIEYNKNNRLNYKEIDELISTKLNSDENIYDDVAILTDNKKVIIEVEEEQEWF